MTNIVDAVSDFVENRLERLHTAVPGVIQSYDAGKHIAKVLPTVRLVTGKGVKIPLPVVDNVPVVFPTAAGFSLNYPLAKGDQVILFFAENGIGNWINSDGTAAVDPDDAARFSLTDAFCVPGLTTPSAISQGKLHIEVDSEGGLLIESTVAAVEMDSNGFFSLRNQTQDLLSLIEGLIDEIKNLTTTNAVSGAPCSISPASQALLEAYKLEFEGLLK